VSPRLQLQLDRERYRAGETVRGTVAVTEGGSSRSLEVSLAYNEETSDYLDVARTISSGPLHEGDLDEGRSFEFELALPDDALPGYQSARGELYWVVDARSNELGRDTHERRRIDVETAERAP
jgi:hypothetical protein